jgi:hypothetical protein
MTTETKAPTFTDGEEITVRGDGINWVWYHTYVYHDSMWGEGGHFFPKGEGYRLHKFDERQGSEQHPTNAVSISATIHRPHYRQIKAFGMDVITRWVKLCEGLGVRDDEMIMVICLSDGRKMPIHGQGK